MKKEIKDLMIKIKEDSEGIRLSTYRCSANVLTIGLGHTGKEAYPGNTISKERAYELFYEDVETFELGFRKLLQKYKVTWVNDRMIAALISLSFNTGLGFIEESSIFKALVKKDIIGAGLQIASIRNPKDGYPRGLQVRRNKEIKLFFGLYDDEYNLLESVKTKGIHPTEFEITPLYIPDKNLTVKGKAISNSEFEIFQFPYGKN